ncbi:MAG: DUF192 domain-containing protein, partial [Pseudomonadota bacterium]
MIQTRTVEIDGHPFSVGVADTALSRMRGLSFRDRPTSDGMLFIFPFRRRWSLWMLGMRIAIDVVWIDNGRVVGIERGIARPPNVRESLT